MENAINPVYRRRLLAHRAGMGLAIAAMAVGLGFITTAEWDPVNDKFGALIAITGTLVTSFIALLLAFPVSFGIALFLTEI